MPEAMRSPIETGASGSKPKRSISPPRSGRAATRGPTRRGRSRRSRAPSTKSVTRDHAVLEQRREVEADVAGTRSARPSPFRSASATAVVKSSSGDTSWPTPKMPEPSFGPSVEGEATRPRRCPRRCRPAMPRPCVDERLVDRRLDVGYRGRPRCVLSSCRAGEHRHGQRRAVVRQCEGDEIDRRRGGGRAAPAGCRPCRAASASTAACGVARACRSRSGRSGSRSPRLPATMSRSPSLSRSASAIDVVGSASDERERPSHRLGIARRRRSSGLQAPGAPRVGDLVLDGRRCRRACGRRSAAAKTMRPFASRLTTHVAGVAHRRRIERRVHDALDLAAQILGGPVVGGRSPGRSHDGERSCAVEDES